MSAVNVVLFGNIPSFLVRWKKCAANDVLAPCRWCMIRLNALNCYATIPHRSSLGPDNLVRLDRRVMSHIVLLTCLLNGSLLYVTY